TAPTSSPSLSIGTATKRAYPSKFDGSNHCRIDVFQRSVARQPNRRREQLPSSPPCVRWDFSDRGGMVSACEAWRRRVVYCASRRDVERRHPNERYFQTLRRRCVRHSATSSQIPAEDCRERC